MKGNPQVRTGLLGAVGFYLIYLAWKLLSAMKEGGTGMAPWLSVVFSVAFAGAGLTVLIYACRIWKLGKKKEEEETAESERKPD